MRDYIQQLPSVTGDSADGESAEVPVSSVAVIAPSKSPMNPVTPRRSTTPVSSVPGPQQTSCASNTTSTSESIRLFPKTQAKLVRKGREKR